MSGPRKRSPSRQTRWNDSSRPSAPCTASPSACRTTAPARAQSSALTQCGSTPRRPASQASKSSTSNIRSSCFTACPDAVPDPRHPLPDPAYARPLGTRSFPSGWFGRTAWWPPTGRTHDWCRQPARRTYQPGGAQGLLGLHRGVADAACPGTTGLPIRWDFDRRAELALGWVFVPVHRVGTLLAAIASTAAPRDRRAQGGSFDGRQGGGVDPYSRPPIRALVRGHALVRVICGVGLRRRLTQVATSYSGRHPRAVAQLMCCATEAYAGLREHSTIHPIRCTAA